MVSLQDHDKNTLFVLYCLAPDFDFLGLTIFQLPLIFLSEMESNGVSL